MWVREKIFARSVQMKSYDKNILQISMNVENIIRLQNHL